MYAGTVRRFDMTREGAGRGLCVCGGGGEEDEEDESPYFVGERGREETCMYIVFGCGCCT